MGNKIALSLLLSLSLLGFPGCASLPPPSPDTPPVPLAKANWELVMEENRGLEISLEDAKDLRDLYRGGVQQKAKAEEFYRQKDFRGAMKRYEASNDFLLPLLQKIQEDSAQFPLFEDTSILFFPNLLLADNHFKMGLILRAQGQVGSAQRRWKKALPPVQQSIRTERTEWGLALQEELFSLLSSPNK